MKKILLMTVFLLSLAIVLPGCGSGSGGGSSNLTCAPASPSAATVDLNTATLGQWTLALTQTSSTCPEPPDSISCLLTMVVTGNDVAISGTCTPSPNPAGISVDVNDIAGIVSGSTLYWGGTMSGSLDDYSETDTVPCTGVNFPSNTQSATFNVTVAVAWTLSGDSGTCETTFSAQFR